MSSTIFKIKSTAVAKFETTDEEKANKRLAEIRKQDPAARLLKVPVSR